MLVLYSPSGMTEILFFLVLFFVFLISNSILSYVFLSLIFVIKLSNIFFFYQVVV